MSVTKSFIGGYKTFQNHTKIPIIPCMLQFEKEIPSIYKIVDDCSYARVQLYLSL